MISSSESSRYIILKVNIFINMQNQPCDVYQKRMSHSLIYYPIEIIYGYFFLLFFFVLCQPTDTEREKNKQYKETSPFVYFLIAKKLDNKEILWLV